jgi:hypothetical protein
LPRNVFLDPLPFVRKRMKELCGDTPRCGSDVVTLSNHGADEVYLW